MRNAPPAPPRAKPPLEPELVDQVSAAPTRKVTAATAGSGLGAAISILVSYLLTRMFPGLPEDVIVATSVALLAVGSPLGAFAMGYLTRERAVPCEPQPWVPPRPEPPGYTGDPDRPYTEP